MLGFTSGRWYPFAFARVDSLRTFSGHNSTHIPQPLHLLGMRKTWPLGRRTSRLSNGSRPKLFNDIRVTPNIKLTNTAPSRIQFARFLSRLLVITGRLLSDKSHVTTRNMAGSLTPSMLLSKSACAGGYVLLVCSTQVIMLFEGKH